MVCGVGWQVFGVMVGFVVIVESTRGVASGADVTVPGVPFAVLLLAGLFELLDCRLMGTIPSGGMGEVDAWIAFSLLSSGGFVL